jgi:hypothetical protein
LPVVVYNYWARLAAFSSDAINAISKSILIHPKMRRRVLDAVQLRRVARHLGDDVQPELVVEVARLLPLVGREADGPRPGASLGFNVADTLLPRQCFNRIDRRRVVFDELSIRRNC